MNRKRWLVMLVSLVAALSFSGGAWAGLADSMLGTGIDALLGKQLGLTGDQSKGGIGAILSLAKGKLSPADYGKVASAIPGADKYVAKAQSLKSGGSTLPRRSGGPPVPSSP